jgi:hypothetical protein
VSHIPVDGLLSIAYQVQGLVSIFKLQNFSLMESMTNQGQEQKIILVQEEPRDASQLVEIPVNTAGISRVAIPDIQQLRSMVNQSIIIKGIRLITDNVLTNAPTNGSINAPLAELQKISLTLYSEGWERGQLIPVLVLNDISGDAAGVPFRFHPTKFANWKNVDWSKSYLQFSNGTTSADTPYTVLLDVEYLKLDAQGKAIEGAS